MFVIKPTIDVFVNEIPPFSPRAEEQRAATKNNRVLNQICDGIDAQLREFLSDPNGFLQKLRERITNEPLASRFQPTLREEAQALLRSEGKRLCEFPEGEISLKRYELLHQLNSVIETRIPYQDIDHASEILLPSLRTLLIHFEFSKHEM